MTDKRLNALIEKLDVLLDREHAALMAGALDQLDPITQQKTALIDALRALEAPEREALAPIRQKAERNQVLFDSAMKGVRAVANRMADLRSVRSGLATYDNHGRRADNMSGAQSSVEKRA